MYLSSPMKMATCPGRHRMSPGSASETGTLVPNAAWSSEFRGMEIPAWAYHYVVSPEQSSPTPGVVPPQT